MFKANDQKLLSYWLKLLVVLILIIGICFRFSNLERKVYWRDEVATSLMISGYTRSEVYQEAYDGKIRKIRELYKYQYPTSERNLGDTIRVLAIEDSQHPPLYYAIARLWSEIVGSSPKAIRALSVSISLLTFPCFYWLSFELFGSIVTGWIVIALTSVSLFHLMYAQEAREYVLWIVITLISSAVFLRAIRLENKVGWGLYGITVALGLYTYPFTVFVMLGHGVYLLIIEQFRFTRNFLSYLLACFGGIVIFSPWILTIINYANSENTAASWLIQEILPQELLRRWILNISYLFVSAKPRVYFPILALILYSLYFLCSRTPKRTWLFILAMMGSIAIPLVAVDLIIGARISITNRYLVPWHLSVQLAVAYLIGYQLTVNCSWLNKQKILRFIGLTIMTILLLLGCWTCLRFVKTESGWNKGDFYNLPISRIINQSPNPLIISNVSVDSFLSMVHLLNPEVNVQLLDDLNELEVNQNFTDIFIFKPTLELANLIEEKYQAKAKVDYRGGLYRLTKFSE